MASLCVGALTCSTFSTTARAQTVASRLVVGRVLGPDGLPLAWVTIRLTGQDGTIVGPVQTDSAGRYRLVVPPLVQPAFLTTSMLGYARERLSMPTTSSVDGMISLPDIQLRAFVPTLDAVAAVVERARPIHAADERRARPGERESDLDLSGQATGDVTGNVRAALLDIPGVTVNPMSGAPTAFGIGDAQNSNTLNGGDFSGTPLPRDGLRRTVRLGTYDPKVGRFAGLQIKTVLPSGTAMVQRTLHATLDDPVLQASSPLAVSQDVLFRDRILSGAASGPAMGTTFYSTAFQVGQLFLPDGSLASLTDAGLRTQGLSAVTLDTLRTLAVAKGAPGSFGLPHRAVTTDVSAIGRVDLTAAEGPMLRNELPTLYLLSAVGIRDGTGGGSGSATLPFAPRERRDWNAQLQVTYGPYFRSLLSETSLSGALDKHRETSGPSAPSASVVVTSNTDQGADVSTVTLGGSGGTMRESDARQLQLRNETSWSTRDRSHTISLYGDATLSRLARTALDNGNGAYTFGSLADFATDNALAYSRTLSPTSRVTGSSRFALALGDVFYASEAARSELGADGDGLKVELGLRVEGERSTGGIAPAPALDSFATNALKSGVSGTAVLPMLGFTWNRGVYRVFSGPATFTETKQTLAGGIRWYRGVLSDDELDAFSRHTGGVDGIRQLQCFSGNTPRLDWATGANAPLPQECLTPPANRANTYPVVDYLSRGVSPPRSLRAELSWRWLVADFLSASVSATEAFNSRGMSRFDVNLAQTPRGVLTSEGGRLVYVVPEAVVSGGIVDISSSRRSTAFGEILEHRSDVGSRNQTLTAAADYRWGATRFLSPSAPRQPRARGALRVAYTRSTGREQLRGLDATTVGDPRLVEERDVPLPAHTITVNAGGAIDGWFSFGISGRIMSGVHYSPMVSGDINGDGLANDRAFIFDPAAAPDIRADLLNMYGGANGGCLRAQIGLLAREGSCIGPWSATVNAVSLTLDPYLTHLGNRGSISLIANNVLSGLDRIVHGPQDIRGWGNAGFPDAVLLVPKGYDASTGRNSYTVNPRFGTVPSVISAPFRVTLDVHLTVGPDVEAQAIAAALARGSDERPLTALEVKERLLSSAGVFNDALARTLLEHADSLHLSPAQRSGLDSVAKEDVAFRDSTYADLAARLTAPDALRDAKQQRSYWHGAIAASVRHRYGAALAMRRLLDATQLAWVQRHNLAPALDYSPMWLERLLREPLPAR